ncbi:MAG: response regulator transcription factor [Chloroflexi bacterium]|nr:response regulator transcription factor [Chloroflexota bacterium]MCC6895731.1 response regulator transcription factor [Anaerolineae bacterium]
MEPRQHILIVDDQENIRSALGTFLGRMGYQVDTASTGLEALAIVEKQEPDLVLLDVVLDERDQSQMSGLEVCRRLRSREHFIPIIMLTSYPEWQVESLGQGAIAFVTKPWDNNALANQIRATLGAVSHIRRETLPSGTTNNQLKVRGDIQIDLEHFRVSRAGQQIDLTPIEFALLAFLARNPNRHWTREELLNHVWDYTWAGYERTVDRHIAALRRKLKLERDELIETVHGVGYRLLQE